ncbi:MAG: hypothetical protein Q8L68_06380 [Methylococcales bacterium]|nr:hypothetical protein [Methylococcales bacterium]
MTQPLIYQFALGLAILASLSLPKTLYAADSCNALLTVGIYNVSQSSSANEGESMAKSTFCSADYSLSSTTSSQQASIKASFMSYFSGGVSGSVSDSQIIETQHNVCTSGFNSSSYSNEASSYSHTIYQGALDAWNQCNALASKGLNFEIQADNTMQGVAVSLSTASTGTSGKFLGLTQVGLGSSVCKTTTAKGQVITLAENTLFNLNSASKLTVICKRNMRTDGSGNLFADDQTLFFNTSTGAYQVPLAGIGSLSRRTVDTIRAQIDDAVETMLANTSNILTTKINSVSNKQNALETKVDTLATNQAIVSAGAISSNGTVVRSMGLAFTVSKVQTGTYRVNFSSPFTKPAIVVALSDGGTSGSKAVLSVNDAAGFTIETRSYNTNGLSDAGFNFIVGRSD